MPLNDDGVTTLSFTLHVCTLKPDSPLTDPQKAKVYRGKGETRFYLFVYTNLTEKISRIVFIKM